MFASIRRHSKWLWFVIATLTIISFVAFFSPSQQFGGGGGAGGNIVVGSINGNPLYRDEYFAVAREARLYYFLSYRQWPEENEMSRQLGILDREIKNRLVQIEKLNQFDVRVGEDAAAQWITDLFKDPARQVFNKEFYDQFLRDLNAKIGMRPRDFERFVRHQVGIQHLVNVMGTSGKLVTPQEAEAVFRREHEQVDTKVVLFSSSNYVDRVNVGDHTAIATHYTNNQAAYRTPERLQVSYVKFETTNFLAAADQSLAQDTNRVNQAITAVYEQRGTNYYKGPGGEALSPDQAKEKIRDEIRRETAQIEARKKATEFMDQLFKLEPVKAENLDKVAAATGQQVAVSQPFSQFETPAGLNLPSGFGSSAFKLTPEDPFFAEPLVTEPAVYVVALKGRQPSILPPLEEVLGRVVTEYQKSQARSLANAAGSDIHRDISTALAQGKTFEAAAAESNVEVVDLPPFSQKTMSLSELAGRADLSTIKNIAFTLAPGGLSAYTAGRDGGAIIFLEKKVPATDEQVKAGLAEQTKTMRQSRAYEAYSEWLRKEVELAKIVLPTDKQEETKPQPAQP